MRRSCTVTAEPEFTMLVDAKRKELLLVTGRKSSLSLRWEELNVTAARRGVVHTQAVGLDPERELT